MSTLYNLEPQPTAKVVLQTTLGEVELELFAKQIPLASRNFLQHCLDGYYNGTIFHRVVPGFIVQGGDPTGTGFGGESVFEDGAPFEDEFHSRLKYNRRGLLGMANSGKENDNGSQFFFTLGVTPELAGKNTLFGRVVGDTIFNVIKMGDVDMAEEGGERPLYPTKITGAEILVNPFEDMVKRELTARSTGTKAEKATKKPKRKAGKALLSFGDEDEGVEVPAVKKPKFNTKLVSGGVNAASNPANEAAKASKPPTKPKPARSPSPPPPPPSKHESTVVTSESLKESKPNIRSASSPSPTPSPPPVSKQNKTLANTEAEYAALKASLRRTGPTTTAVKEKPKSALEAMIPSTSTRGRKRGAVKESDEARALAMFKAFKNKLDTVDANSSEEDAKSEDHEDKIGSKGDEIAARAQDEDEEAALCDLHFIVNCQSCGNWTANGDDDDDTGEGWLRHKLSFAKDRLGKDLEWKRKNEEELLVVDPREKAKELGLGKSGSKDRKGREWDKGREGKGGKVK
jgi:peptidyl-prolyl cis-trans isomerase SDCCAG10